MASTADAQAATLARFIKGWKSWTPAGMLNPMSATFTQLTLPTSLGHTARSKAQVEFMLPKLMETVREYQLEIRNIVHDTGKAQAAVYAVSTGITDFGGWNNEYAVFIWFSEEGRQIIKIEEMVDSAFMQEFMLKFQQHMVESGMLRTE